jgi:Tol biopolymer transport system component
MRKSLSGLLVCVVLLGLAPGAEAAFPGTNGKIAFQTNRDGNEEIYSMNPGGGVQTNLTNDPLWDRSPAWSADGGKVAFSKLAGTARHQIYRMNADGTGQTRVSPTDVWSYDKPSWSPDGTQIVAHANRDPGGSQLDIVRMDADGTDEVVLTFDSSGVDVDPAWSPDGGRIAFASRRGASSMDIYVMGADGSSPVELTGDSLDSESQPNWSPDGQRIAYVREVCVVGSPCAYSIHVMSSDGSGDVTLTSGASETLSSPAWSPDGSKIVYQRNFPGNAAIHVINADGSGDVQIGGNPAQDVDPDWQPVVTGYPRPKGATPLRVALVPAFGACTSPDRTHGPPLAFPSCASPLQGSPNLTVGTPDANGATANFQGSVRLDARAGTPGPPEDSSVPVSVAMTDVRCQAGVATCGAANSGGGADYTGEVQLRLDLRITDKYNATAPGGGFEPATVQDLSLAVPVLCFENTTATNIGSTCSVATEMDFFYPGISKDTRRTIWEVGGVRVLDGGADGDADTAGNSLFAVQGLFVP